jgi:hypothetical protein
MQLLLRADSQWSPSAAKAAQTYGTTRVVPSRNFKIRMAESLSEGGMSFHLSFAQVFGFQVTEKAKASS